MELKALKRIDLNLLISLQILLEESNVSRAAERLFITQPAMSKTLGRLRDVFDDPLFVRGPHGITPTTRALELKSQLEPILEDINVLVSPQVFDPSKYVGEVSVAISEFMAITIMPELMQRLQQQAPGLKINSISRVEHQLEHLAHGDLDIALHIQRKKYSKDFITHQVAGGMPVFLCRQGHPLTQQEITLENIVNYAFVTFYISDREELTIFQNEADSNVAIPNDHSRFETGHLLTALEVVRSTDMLMVGPPHILENPKIGQGLCCMPIPTSHTIVNYIVATHKRTDRSQAIQWVKQQLIDICEQQRDAEQNYEIKPCTTNT